jgi:HEAT repeat protein
MSAARTNRTARLAKAGQERAVARMGSQAWRILLLLLSFSVVGCGVTPRNFQALTDPAPLTRARAVGLGKNLPEREVIPALIGRLDDRDPVVRLSANEELKRRSHQDFGFVAWADVQERAPAVSRWRTWWNARQAGLVNSRRNP